MRLANVGEVFGSAVVVGSELVQGEARKRRLEVRDDASGSATDLTGWTVSVNAKGYTADGAAVDALSNFSLMPVQPAELSGVVAAIEGDAANGLVTLTVPDDIFADVAIAANQQLELPVLAVWVFLNNGAGDVSVVRQLFLYRYGGG